MWFRWRRLVTVHKVGRWHRRGVFVCQSRSVRNKNSNVILRQYRTLIFPFATSKGTGGRNFPIYSVFPTSWSLFRHGRFRPSDVTALHLACGPGGGGGSGGGGGGGGQGQDSKGGKNNENVLNCLLLFYCCRLKKKTAEVGATRLSAATTVVAVVSSSIS